LALVSVIDSRYTNGGLTDWLNFNQRLKLNVSTAAGAFRVVSLSEDDIDDTREAVHVHALGDSGSHGLDRETQRAVHGYDRPHVTSDSCKDG
jgi:hypothetical protein